MERCGAIRWKTRLKKGDNNTERKKKNHTQRKENWRWEEKLKENVWKPHIVLLLLLFRFFASRFDRLSSLFRD